MKVKNKELAREFKKWLNEQIQLGEQAGVALTNAMQKTLKENEKDMYQANLVIHNSNIDLLQTVKEKYESLERETEAFNDKVN